MLLSPHGYMFTSLSFVYSIRTLIHVPSCFPPSSQEGIAVPESISVGNNGKKNRKLLELLDRATVEYRKGEFSCDSTTDDENVDEETGVVLPAGQKASLCTIRFENGSVATMSTDEFWFNEVPGQSAIKLAYKIPHEQEDNGNSTGQKKKKQKKNDDDDDDDKYHKTIILVWYVYGEMEQEFAELSDGDYEAIKANLGLNSNDDDGSESAAATTRKSEFLAALLSKSVPCNDFLSTGWDAFDEDLHEDTPAFLRAKRLLPPPVAGTTATGAADAASSTDDGVESSIVVYVERSGGGGGGGERPVFMRVVPGTTRLSDIKAKYFDIVPEEASEAEDLAFECYGMRQNDRKIGDDPTAEEMQLEDGSGITVTKKK